VLCQVLTQEMLRYNKLLVVIRASLLGLRSALSGVTVLSSELESVMNSMSVGRVPALWRGASYPSMKPLAGYMTDLLARLQMLQSWYEKGTPPVFWISGFFFTPSFTTAVLQNYARARRAAIDSIAFNFEVMRQDAAMLSQPPHEGAYISGMFLEGAGWDTRTLTWCESKPKVLYEVAPVIWLRPVRLADASTAVVYECPAYRTAERRGVLATTGHSTNFLMMIRLPTEKPPTHWILRGVCLLCSLPE
jgi:dynein heavy chain